MSSPPPLGPPGRPASRPPARYGWVAAAVLVVLVLFFFDPARYGFYPPCLFHQFTGLKCPGCGSLRALHHLLHGELLTALQFNALLVLGTLLGTVLAGSCAWSRWRGRRAGFQVRRGWLWAAVALVVLFGVLRNLGLPFLAFAGRP